MRLADLAGHERAVERLRRSVAVGRVPAAILTEIGGLPEILLVRAIEL